MRITANVTTRTNNSLNLFPLNESSLVFQTKIIKNKYTPNVFFNMSPEAYGPAVSENEK